MKAKQNVDKTMVTKAVITKIQGDFKPQFIKAQHVNDYNDPDTIYVKGSKTEKGYKPDIIASKGEQINIYEIELDDKLPVTKWRFFSNYAREHNGEFYIVVPDYLKEDVKKEIQDKDIYSGLIYFKTR